MDATNPIPLPLPTKAPTAIQIIRGVLILRMVFYLLAFCAIVFIDDSDPTERSGLKGVRHGVVNLFNLAAESTDKAVQFGTLIGYTAIPILLLISLYLAVQNRSFVVAIVIVSLDVLIGFGQGYSLVSILILCCILTKPARYYLKKMEMPIPKSKPLYTPKKEFVDTKITPPISEE